MSDYVSRLVEVERERVCMNIGLMTSHASRLVEVELPTQSEALKPIERNTVYKGVKIRECSIIGTDLVNAIETKSPLFYLRNHFLPLTRQQHLLHLS